MLTQPSNLAYAILVGDKLRNQWNYADLGRKVAKVAACLDEVFAPGKRALLVYHHSLEFRTASFACLCRNVVAVPVPALETWNLLRTMPRLAAVAEDAAASFVLTSSQIFKRASQRRMVDGEERLGLGQELNRKSRPSEVDHEKIALKIRESLFLQFEIRPYAVALVRRGAIPKTSRGKLQRTACRAALLVGELPTIFQLGDGPLALVVGI